MAFLELKNIYKSYYLDKEEFPVLKGINLQFDRENLCPSLVNQVVGSPL